MLKKRLVLLIVLAIAILLVYSFTFLGTKPDFVIPRRLIKVAAMVLISCSIAYSSVIFQTITSNRILTPSIMGFESVYLLFQTLIVYLYSDATFQVITSETNFMLSVVMMVGFAFLLYQFIFRKEQSSVYFLLLVGLILSTVFRNITSFMHMLIDPNEFSFVENRLFASFNNINTSLLGISAVILVLSLIIGARFLNQLDVLHLGKEKAINLGINYKRLVKICLFIIAIQVSVSTALVGPITFLGILIANLSYEFLPTHKHKFLISGAALISIILVVGGQYLVEQYFDFSTTISILINFIGGVYFMILLLKKKTI